jgi:hypothetical protein
MHNMGTNIHSSALLVIVLITISNIMEKMRKLS